VSGAFWRKTDETKTKVIAQNIIKNIYEKNEVAAGEVTGVSHLSKTLKGAGSIVVGTIQVGTAPHAGRIVIICSGPVILPAQPWQWHTALSSIIMLRKVTNVL
jgi:hypothetical protein